MRGPKMPSGPSMAMAAANMTLAIDVLESLEKRHIKTAVQAGAALDVLHGQTAALRMDLESARDNLARELEGML